MSSTTFASEKLTSMQIRTGAEKFTQRSAQAISGTVCEILLVTLESNRILSLHLPTEGEDGTWLVPHVAGMHPSQTVLQHLEACFGDAFEANMSIIHSTSWRYSYQLDQLILTYLVVLPYRDWMDQWATVGWISIQHIGAIEKVQGNNLFPPEIMERDDVLAHALDHLALLSQDDRSIQSVLEPEWMGVLQTRLPRPAGLMQYVPSSSLQLPSIASTNFMQKATPCEFLAC